MSTLKSSRSGKSLRYLSGFGRRLQSLFYFPAQNENKVKNKTRQLAGFVLKIRICLFKRLTVPATRAHVWILGRVTRKHNSSWPHLANSTHITQIVYLDHFCACCYFHFMNLKKPPISQRLSATGGPKSPLFSGCTNRVES